LHSFPRPSEPHLFAAREPVSGTCPDCGAAQLAEYRVLGEGGWRNVRKCQNCLFSVERTPAPVYGSYTPLGLEI
jgi:vanillate/4-hydroxybenzoate decarboxylase subunit D